MPLSADQILRIPLLPVLAAQGIWVGARALKLPEPPGPRSGQSGNGPPLALLILGDSASAGVGAKTQGSALSGCLSRRLATDFSLDWHLEGETSATTRTSLRKLGQLPRREYDIALLVHGVNDTTRFTPKARFKSRQSRLIEHLAANHGTRRFILSGLPPMHHFPLLPQPLRWVLGEHAARLDRALAELAQERDGVSHLALDLPFDPKYVARDGFHPSEDAYDVWAEMLAQAITRAIRP